MSLKYRFRQGWFGNQILQVLREESSSCRFTGDEHSFLRWRDANQEEADDAFFIILKCDEWDLRESFFGKYVLWHKSSRADCYHGWRKADISESRSISIILNKIENS